MIVLDPKATVPLYQQIYEQLRNQIIEGRLVKGMKLPSTRALASQLQVSRNTVEYAYLQLVSEGYAISRTGSGFRVEALDPDSLLQLPQRNHSAAPPISAQPHLAAAPDEAFCDFRYGSLRPDSFPLRIWKRVAHKALAALTPEQMTAYSNPHGELALRGEILSHLAKTRGVICTAEQLIVSSGMESSLGLLCQLLGSHPTGVAIEDPGYPGAKAIFTNHGYPVLPVGLDLDGIRMDELADSGATLVYVTPSHQFPTGTVMPIKRRLQLLDWAARQDGLIIEDDYDGDLRYNTRPIPSIQSIDREGRVVYIGTFSKALAPSLRLNYMVLPLALLERLKQPFAMYQTSVPLFEQEVLYRFMHEGHWERHLRRMLLTNKKSHDLLIRAIERQMGDRVRIHGSQAGLHILLEVNNGMKEQQLIARANDAKVHVMPVSLFWTCRQRYSDNMVLLAFSRLSEAEILSGIKRLTQAWF